MDSCLLIKDLTKRPSMNKVFDHSSEVCQIMRKSRLNVEPELFRNKFWTVPGKAIIKVEREWAGGEGKGDST